MIESEEIPIDLPKPGKGESKTARIPIPIVPASTRLPKPAWLRVHSTNNPEVQRLKQVLREAKLHTVCEEASCPNIGECFAGGTATFMILGDLCTRRCPFCDVGHGKPLPVDSEEPLRLARTIAQMGLRFVVITSVDRDDLRDGGAAHFAAVIREIRVASPQIGIEILVPDFRGRMDKALAILQQQPPEVFNHNIETVPRLYRQARPGSDYQHSLKLLAEFKALCPQVPTKSGLMLGLGETLDEVREVIRDLRVHGCDLLTVGQYLAPSQHHLPVARYASPDEFALLKAEAEALGFINVASGPLVRSSYHAEAQHKQGYDRLMAGG